MHCLTDGRECRFLATMVAVTAFLPLGACENESGHSGDHAIAAPPPAPLTHEEQHVNSQDTNRTESLRPRTWEEYRQLASLIADLPAWTDTGPSERAEWQAIIRLAAAFQQLPPEDVSRTLVVYMNQFPGLGLGEPVKHPYTKPLLLLRVMFEIPSDVDRESLQAEMNRSQVYVAGLFGWDAAGAEGLEAGVHQDSPALALPVIWHADDGPRLSAFRKTKPPLIAGGMGTYQPHREFEFFQARFAYRPDLERYLEEVDLFDGTQGVVIRKRVATWRELLHQRRLDAASERK